MRLLSLAALLCALQMFAVPLSAGDIKEADYPVQYEVLSSGKTDKLKVEKSCTMQLRDKSKPNVAINVSKGGFGASCHALESGKVYRGRQNEKKNEIELVITVGEKKARVENWQVDGTVDIAPEALPPG